MPCFFPSLLRSVSVSREGRRGPRTDLILALNLVDPPTPHDKLPIGHDSCFSHKHFSLIIHGLIALCTCTFRRSRGVLEKGGCGITLPFALACWAIAYISGISSKSPWGFSAAWCVCCNRWDAEIESPWVRVPFPFFFAAFCAWLVENEEYPEWLEGWGMGGGGGKTLCTSSCGYSVHVWLVKMRSTQRWGGGDVPTIHGILLKRSKLRRREYGGSSGSITLPYQLAICTHVHFPFFGKSARPPPHVKLSRVATYDVRRDRLWVNIVGNGLYVMYILVGGGPWWGGGWQRKKKSTRYQGRV